MPSEWSKTEARLENSLGISKVGSRQSRGIPPTGGIEPLDSIERDQHPPTTSTPLYRNASGLQLTPSKGAQVLTWTTR